MPLYIDLPRKIMKPKRYYLNINNYHNWHFQVRNKLKIAYSQILAPKVKGLTLSKAGINLHFQLVRGDKRRVDRSNVLCLHEKFFCDGLINAGCIEDDNDKFIISTLYTTGEIDKENPRVDIWIYTT
tara:strand:- start:5611 stop:5991 length:381 start_codon:yes stop_codon:yes gene_type:complete